MKISIHLISQQVQSQKERQIIYFTHHPIKLAKGYLSRNPILVKNQNPLTNSMS